MICLVCGREFEPKGTEENCCCDTCNSIRIYFQSEKNAKNKKREIRKATLCWSCAKALSEKCSWMKKYIPVEGWEAIPTIINDVNGLEMDSYCVIKCPEFEREKK